MMTPIKFQLRKQYLNVLSFLDRHQINLIAAFLFGLGVWTRMEAFGFISGDYVSFLRPWMNQIVSGGGFASLGTTIGDYTPPYMYLLTLLSYFPSASETNPFLFGIKFYSMIFDGLLAFSVYLNVRLIAKKNAHEMGLLASLLVFFLPTVVLNSAYWGQIDASYTAFALFALYFLQKKAYFKSVLWFAIGLSFKLQTIFFLPVFIFYVWFEKKSIWYYIFLIPVVYFAFAIPAMLFGRSLSDLALIYINQADSYRSLTLNMPNLYQWLPNRYDDLSGYGLMLFTSLMGLTFFYAMIKKIRLSSSSIMFLAFWSILMANFFLPAMHERYLFAADVIAVILLIQMPKKWFYVIFVQVISLLAYTPFLFGVEFIKHEEVAVLFLVTVSLASVQLIQSFFTEEQESLS